MPSRGPDQRSPAARSLRATWPTSRRSSGREVVAGLGEKPFRARQLSVHYFERLADDPATMTDLPAAGRGALLAET